MTFVRNWLLELVLGPQAERRKPEQVLDSLYRHIELGAWAVVGPAALVRSGKALGVDTPIHAEVVARSHSMVLRRTRDTTLLAQPPPWERWMVHLGRRTLALSVPAAGAGDWWD